MTAHTVEPRGPFDFTLPQEAGEPLSFDRAYRSEHAALLFFYRGYW